MVCVDEELKMDLLTEPCAVYGEGGRGLVNLTLENAKLSR